MKSPEGGASDEPTADETGGSNLVGDAGSAGAASSTSWPGPIAEGCTPDSWYQSEEACGIALTCEGGTVGGLACTDQGAGVWACACRGAPWTFEVPAFACEHAAAVASELCLEPPDVSALPVQCTVSEERRDANACSIQGTCSKRVALSDGVTAVNGGSQAASCKIGNEGFARCACTAVFKRTKYQFEGVDLSQGCGFVQEICASGELQTIGPKMCSLQSIDVGDDGCNLYQSCRQPIKLNDGTILTSIGTRYAGCTANGAGASTCSCDDNVGAPSFDVEAPANAATCALAIDFCFQTPTIEPAAALACVAVDGFAEPEACGVWLDCPKALIYGGASWWLMAGCRSRVVGIWTVVCCPVSAARAAKRSASMSAGWILPKLARARPTPVKESRKSSSDVTQRSRRPGSSNS